MQLHISYNMNELIKAIHTDKRWSWKERSWLCKVVRSWTDYYIVDIFFPKQKNVAAHTEFSWDPVNELITYLWDKIETFWDYAIRLHSHQWMQAFWSWEDHRTRKGFKDRWCDEFVSVVTSHKGGTNEIDWIYYHATLDIFNPISMDVNLKMSLWLPWITSLEEVPTEEYTKWLESSDARLQAFQLSEEQRKAAAELNKQTALSNIEILKSKYWLSDEDIEWYIKLNEYQPREYVEVQFKWDKVVTRYDEGEYNLDIEAKIKELDAAEEKYTAPVRNGMAYQKRETFWVWLFNGDKNYETLWKQPKVNDKWVIKRVKNKDWTIRLDTFWYPYYTSLEWERLPLSQLSEFYKLIWNDEKDYESQRDKWIRSFISPLREQRKKKEEEPRYKTERNRSKEDEDWYSRYYDMD